ncbi:MAG: hypothetical protein QXQ24_05835 [Nitrososphaeria archaeon]
MGPKVRIGLKNVLYTRESIISEKDAIKKEYIISCLMFFFPIFFVKSFKATTPIKVHIK